MRRKSSETWTRTLAEVECHRRGWEVEGTSWTERYPIAGKGNYRTITRDLFGCWDMLAFTKPNPVGVRKTVAIQFTDADNLDARIAKIRASKWTPILAQSNWGLLAWGFDQKGKLREVEIHAGSFV